MRQQLIKKIILIAVLTIFIYLAFTLFNSEYAYAGSYSGQDLALAILKNDSTLIDSSYVDNDPSGHRQAIVLSSLGTMAPTHNNTFALFSTGVAGYNPVTTDEENPGDERGTWLRNKHGNPRDYATLTMTLQVPLYMHYLYYDVQFFSSEWPEYIGTKYNDKLTITINSPDIGICSCGEIRKIPIKNSPVRLGRDFGVVFSGRE